MGQDIPKQFLPLDDRTVIEWTLSAFDRHHAIDSLVVVCPADHRATMDGILASRTWKRPFRVVTGGHTRRESSWNGICAGNFADDDIVLIHDAARPFVDGNIIDRCIEAARESGAVGTYVRAIDTIAEISGNRVTAIPSRSSLFCAQTPQAFACAVIRNAHEEARLRGIDVTDDVSLVLACGGMVASVEGSYRNMKITTREDYDYARFLARGGA
jgi:2-C-methyl-D-erythritol 4-phosphate cytidylyltransferase